MKIILSYATASLIMWVNFCQPIVADQPQVSSQPVSSLSFSQPRIGIGFAAELAYADAKLSLLPSSGNLGNIQSKLSQPGYAPQLAPCIEFGGNCGNDYYLGLLISWRYSDIKNKSTTPLSNNYTFSHELTLKNYGDIFLKAGYKFTPQAMMYGLFGPTITNWKHKSPILNNSKVVTNNFEMNKTSIGLGLGLGFEYLFKSKYALSIDGTYHFLNTASSTQYVNYSIPLPVPPPNNTRVYAGNVTKKVDLSFATIAVRFTMFFSL